MAEGEGGGGEGEGGRGGERERGAGEPAFIFDCFKIVYFLFPASSLY